MTKFKSAGINRKEHNYSGSQTKLKDNNSIYSFSFPKKLKKLNISINNNHFNNIYNKNIKNNNIIRKSKNNKKNNIDSNHTNINNTYNFNKIKNIEINNYNSLNDYELNNLPYKLAIKYDKRTFFQCYYSLITENNLLLLAIIPKNDYNLISIKISLFLISFCLYFTINGFFLLIIPCMIYINKMEAII